MLACFYFYSLSPLRHYTTPLRMLTLLKAYFNGQIWIWWWPISNGGQAAGQIALQRLLARGIEHVGARRGQPAHVVSVHFHAGHTTGMSM